MRYFLGRSVTGVCLSVVYYNAIAHKIPLTELNVIAYEREGAEAMYMV